MTDPMTPEDEQRIEELLAMPAALLQPEAIELRSEVKRLRREVAEREWSDMLTHQACQNRKHADWWVDSEHNHLCPWCLIEYAAQRYAMADAMRGDACIERDRLAEQLERDRAERQEIRAALIRELRASYRFRKAWQSAKRGRRRARDQVRAARPYIDWLHEQRRAQWKELDRLAGQVRVLAGLIRRTGAEVRCSGHPDHPGPDCETCSDAEIVRAALDGTEADHG